MDVQYIDFTQNVRPDLESVIALLELDNKLSKMYFCTCTIALKISWLDNSMCSLLTAILRKRIESNGLSVQFDMSETSQKLKNFLQRNGFFQYNPINDINNTIVPVKTFKQKDILIFMGYLSKHVQSGTNKFPFSENFAIAIQTNLAEIFSNCEIHSQTDYVYSAGQYFPNLNTFAFCLTDTGIGIPNLIRSKINPNLSSEQTIKWAFSDRNSTKDTVGGLGLKKLKQDISENNGSLFVLSNDVFYDPINDKHYKLPFDFNGTSVILTLNCKEISNATRR